MSMREQSEDVRYLAAPTCPDIRPHTYWLREQAHYPSLAQLARKFLSIPASSASVERLFLICGAIIGARRAGCSDSRGTFVSYETST